MINFSKNYIENCEREKRPKQIVYRNRLFERNKNQMKRIKHKIIIFKTAITEILCDTKSRSLFVK